MAGRLVGQGRAGGGRAVVIALASLVLFVGVAGCEDTTAFDASKTSTTMPKNAEVLEETVTAPEVFTTWLSFRSGKSDFDPTGSWIPERGWHNEAQVIAQEKNGWSFRFKYHSDQQFGIGGELWVIVLVPGEKPPEARAGKVIDFRGRIAKIEREKTLNRLIIDGTTILKISK